MSHDANGHRGRESQDAPLRRPEIDNRKAHANAVKETTMKRIIQAVVAAALFTGAQASFANPFPMDGEPIVLEPQSTYADRHAAGIAMGGSLNPFPSDGEPVVLANEWTHADRNAVAIAAAPSSNPFPSDGEPVVLPSLSTYADQYITERAKLARGESDPALSR
jgi:hypothetical protein